jgi:hypothetical protein
MSVSCWPEPTKEKYVQKFKHLISMVLLTTFVIVFADFPTDFDLNSLAYLMGTIEQGVIAPAWFISIHPGCLSYVTRNIRQSWPSSRFIRLRRSQSRV